VAPEPDLVGERIYLRPLGKADATDTYVGWLNDPETTRGLETGSQRETVASVAEYIERYARREDALFLGIFLKKGDRHIGNVKLDPINRRHRNAVLGILIGDPAVRGQGIAPEAVRVLLRHAFGEMGLHRIDLAVAVDNPAAIRSYQKAGFREEGRLRERVRRGEGYVDALWMGILDRDFGAG
jgi:RimJ/RimL family protein N-acetyltransferase